MRIAVIGGGAIGLLFAYSLSNSNIVTIFTRTKEQAEQLSEHGLTYIANGTSTIRRIQSSAVTTFESGNFDLAIICVKQYVLADLLKQLALTPELPLLFLQNGMGHLEDINNLPSSTVIVGSVEHGALKRNSYTVEHTGFGQTKLAYLKSAATQPHVLSIIAREWNTISFAIQVEEDYLQMLQDKLVVNAVINPLTAVLGVKNGDLLRNPYYYEVFQQLIQEVTEVLGLDVAEYAKHVENICQHTASNESSMFRDVKGRRKTEIETISGYVINIARRQNLDVPLCKLLYRWVKGMEYEGVS